MPLPVKPNVHSNPRHRIKTQYEHHIKMKLVWHWPSHMFWRTTALGVDAELILLALIEEPICRKTFHTQMLWEKPVTERTHVPDNMTAVTMCPHRIIGGEAAQM